MRGAGVGLIVCVITASAVAAQSAVSFEGKTVTLVISSETGGGTDTFGRMVAPFFERYLPGTPGIVIRNIPGGDGMSAMNFMVQQVMPDGYTFVAASNATADPLSYRRPQSQFNPTDFVAIGGAGRSGEVLLINEAAEKRLYDKKAAPVVMGALGGIPRSGMQMTAWGIEFLGWNARWVVGYRGTSELTLALERGEIDMTSTGNLPFIQRLLSTGKFDILVQSGVLKDGEVVARPEFGKSPLLKAMLEGKIKDQTAAQAFEYWADIALTDKWLALPPKTSPTMTQAYRSAYDAMIRDPDFITRGRKISEDFTPQSASEVETLIRKLGNIPIDATKYVQLLLEKQGLKIQ